MSVRRGDTLYSVKKLWKVTQHNEVMLFNIRDFKHMLEMNVWNDGTPVDVMRRKVPDTEHHRERVEAADVDYPIIISRFVLPHARDHYMSIIFKGGKYDVLDGIHRVCKQLKSKRTFIFVVVATQEQIEAAAQ